MYRHSIWSGTGLPRDIRFAFDHFVQPQAAEAGSETAPAWSPRVDIRDEAQRFVILADIPGVDPAQIEVSMDKNVLTIQGTRTTTEESESGKLTLGERAHGDFRRQFTLPDSVDAEGIQAQGRHGVLEIVIPKKAQQAPRRITIHTSH